MEWKQLRQSDNVLNAVQHPDDTIGMYETIENNRGQIVGANALDLNTKCNPLARAFAAALVSADTPVAQMAEDECTTGTAYFNKLAGRLGLVVDPTPPSVATLAPGLSAKLPDQDMGVATASIGKLSAPGSRP